MSGVINSKVLNTLYSLAVEQLNRGMNFSGWSNFTSEKSGLDRLFSLGFVDLPGQIDQDRWGDNEVRPDLEVTDQVLDEMTQEKNDHGLNHDLQGNEIELGMKNNQGQTVTSVLVSIQDNAPIDTAQAVQEGKELLERFMSADPTENENVYQHDFVPDGRSYGGDYYAYSKEEKARLVQQATDKAVLDNNGDGVLSADEMSEGLQNSTLGGNRRRLMVWTDKNGDGKIQDSELTRPDTIQAALPGRTRRLEIARDGLGRYGDKNVHARTTLENKKYQELNDGDYHLEFEGERSTEFVLRALQGKLTVEDYDTNHDHRVDELEQKLVDQEAANLRFRFDKNHDGTVTLDELEAAGAKVRVGKELLTLTQFREKYGNQVQLDPDSYTFDVSKLASSPVHVDSALIQRQAEELYQAMDGWGTNEEKLCQILLGRSAEEIDALKAEYSRRHGQSLEDDVADETSGSLKSALLQALKSGGNKAADNFDAGSDARVLKEAMDGWGTDEDAIFRVLSNRSKEQIEKIKTAYRDMAGESLYDALDSELSGDDWDLAKKLVS